jgi:excisionase family DNA binding protein
LLYTENTQGDYGEPILKVRRVAELLGVSTAAVYARCANGTLRHTRVGSAIRVAFSDLVEFVQEHSKGPASRRLSTFPLLPPHLDGGPVEATPGGESEEFPTPGTEAGEP